ncbi:TPA: phage antirepressor KilAC domain-containing protein [Clostridioides difficile]|uniref:phage antirepressor KilAC domain-containing protein n=1 Tax=Clostridioides difficile TaxID=1496 RepID=UPI00038D78F4|nr:phage antirepressor KilAC domain-containing protein [Clostridioides difficile]EGT4936351.1 Rha family transcriptional regulator [Clostridioides difficile]EGT5050669.1 Rha family transcriptional regulator [Clostridioides difficile]EGT5525352.1 Rha family transcriptional regulator [Clostridioides difficile]EGT5560714.1 Rha family transcriptional regulator [Clostridioides difficile]EJA6787452.1 phage antirepressor KilAC domain-containing protein [Clostridioides difficile]
MSNLTIINQNNQFLVESREVAELIEKKHDNLLRDIRGYKKILEDSSNLRSQDFFIESTYINTQNKIQPCYLLTKKGCDMVANKMTGEKGIIFTAIYVTKFEEMEQELKEKQPKLPTTYKEALQHLIEQVEVNEKLQLESKIKDQVINELKPKADYTDTILKSDSLVTITQIAKDYGMSGTEMNKLLHKLKVQYKQSDQWLLYKEHQGKSYTQSDTIEIIRSNGTIGSKMTTKWTQKGRLFLHDLLKANNILPDIEKSDQQLSMLS